MKLDKYAFLLFLLLSFCFTVTVKAQEDSSAVSPTEPSIPILTPEEYWNSPNKEGKVLFYPLVFDSINTVELLPLFPEYRVTWENEMIYPFHETNFEKKYREMLLEDFFRRRSMYKISLEMPEKIEYYDLKPYDENLERFNVEEKEIYITGLEPMAEEPELGDIKKYLKQKEKSPWSFDGSLAMQFSQYYVTDNWSKGGTPNATFLTIFDYNIDYKKDRLVWENSIDVKVGFYNTSEDTLHTFRVNNDVFQLGTLLGYQTWFSKKVYYSAAIDFNTSLFPSYKKINSKEVVASFLSPTTIFFSLGMECRYNKKNTIRLAPVTYKVLFSVDDRVDHLHVGLDSTQTYTTYLGYMLRAKMDWKFTKEIHLNSNLYFFSSYNCKNIELNWETVGKFIINRYLSTRLSLIMRYDNTAKDEDAKIQIQEQLSFGFNYIFRR